MKINFTKKEYRQLLDMVYVADWMMNAHATCPEEKHEEYAALREKICSHYKEMGAEDIIEYCEELGGHFELSEYDEILHNKFIAPYDDKTFWDELMERLAERDVVKTIGLERYGSLDAGDQITMLGKMRGFYEHEFGVHGLERIKLDDDKETKH